MIVEGPGFNSLDTFVLNWKTLPFPPSRNGLPFNETTPGNKFHSTYFQSNSKTYYCSRALQRNMHILVLDILLKMHLFLESEEEAKSFLIQTSGKSKLECKSFESGVLILFKTINVLRYCILSFDKWSFLSYYKPKLL